MLESVPLLATVDSKGKAMEAINPKKRKLIKTVEATPKKTKLLASAMSIVADVEVYCCPYSTMSSLLFKTSSKSLFFLCRLSRRAPQLLPSNPWTSRNPWTFERRIQKRMQKKRKEIALPSTVIVSAERFEQSHSNVVEGILDELTAEKGMGE